MVLLKAQKTFSVRSLFGNWALFPNFSSKTHRTCLTHHISIYLGLSGLKLNIPDTTEQILGRFSTDKQPIYSWKAAIADLCKYIVIYLLS